MDGYLSGVGQAAAALGERIRSVRQPFSGATLPQLQAMVNDIDLDAPLGDTAAALREVADLYLDHAIWFHEPTYVAHLNCPVALPALSAEVLLAAVNSSVDTYDQSTTATLIERRLIDWTAARIGFGAGADGVFTSGGTQSNLHGLLLAREEAIDTATDGIADARTEALAKLRILATTESHFSVGKSAGLLGLAADAVVPVATDGTGRMDPAALARAIDDVRASGLVAMAVVATAGTTDLGCIDPLEPIGELCTRRGVWLHVDAAYGCGLLISPTRRHLIDGIERADSVTVDYHKSFFQPVSCSAIVVRRGATMRRVSVHADYLNPKTAAFPNQVDKSLQTTRRFDALKLWMTLRSMGADELGRMFDAVMDLAVEAHGMLADDPDFEVAAAPTLSTVLFRYRPEWLDAASCDRLMPMLRGRLFARGAAIVAGTTLGGHHWLKFTLLNPNTTTAHLALVLDLIREAGIEILDAEWDHPEVPADANV
ncbi:pyridoxal-dependent decarboxylase [Virgisporangium aliadipatigenens]|uniref:Pyridoxal-dependent decarboxylase n=1 Tax=Virgisporangium aliadipatigenens TaxID=741659 RepID=A0A8J3YLZ4_9ACTN|nr:pyridoxal-dependent decarboxylase [Virgisporangium aliadipatigenens]